MSTEKDSEKMKKYFNSNDARSLINTYGFSIFPIHGIKEDGTCTCNNPSCNNVGKHPATPDGFKSASNDIERVKQLWSGRTGLNVGIATGEKSGVFVIDIDSPEAEIELYKKFKIPNTYTVNTGRGKHLYFKYDPNRPIRNGTNIIDNVDIRGDGGYVAGAGSNHARGTQYEVVNQLEEFADCPDELYEFCLSKKEKKFENSLLDTPYNPLLNKLTDGWTIDQVKEHLSYISPDVGYDEWINVGMGLHSEGISFDVFDEWSRKGTKYDGSTAQHWKTFTKGGGVSYGTVVAYAKAGGWSYNRSETQKNKTIIEIINSETGEITETDTQKDKPINKMYLIKGSDITYEPISTDFVQGLLTSGSFSVVYGESNCGKTFFMTDLSFHVSEGKSWRDKRVEKGAVIYVALEGMAGLKGRIEAYRKETKETLQNFYVMPCPFDFLDAQGDVYSFLKLLETAKQDIGDIKMIVIDTLARAIGGGDENSGQDMGMLVKHADAIRDYTGAHICFIHHSGKDKAKGARGHSSLRAAVDTEIEISRNEGDDFSLVKVVKQRDLEKEDDTAFKLKSIEIGENQYFETQTSCVVEFIEIDESKVKSTKLTDMQQFVYDAIVHSIMSVGRVRRIYGYDLKSISYDDMREVLEQRGYKEMLETKNRTTAQQIKSTTQTVRVALQKKGKIGMDGEYVWLLNEETSFNGRDD
jgi:hypothetical protein